MSGSRERELDPCRLIPVLLQLGQTNTRVHGVAVVRPDENAAGELVRGVDAAGGPALSAVHGKDLLCD